MKLSIALQLLLATYVAAGNANNDETAAKTKGGFLRGSDDKLPPAGRELTGTCPCFGASDLAGHQTNRCNFFDNGNVYVSLQGGAFFALSADSCSYSGGDSIRNIPAEDKAACVDVLQEACYPPAPTPELTPAPTPEPTPAPTPDPCSDVECGLGYTCVAGFCVTHESSTSFLREDTYYVISVPVTNEYLHEVGQGQITTELDHQMDVVTQIPVFRSDFGGLPKHATAHWRFSAKFEGDTFVSYEIINRYTGRRIAAESINRIANLYFDAYTVQPPTNLNHITGCPCFEAEHLQGETENCLFHEAGVEHVTLKDGTYFSNGFSSCSSNHPSGERRNGLSSEESKACSDLLDGVCPRETLTEVIPIGFEYTTAELNAYGIEHNSYLLEGFRFVITEVEGYLPRDHFPEATVPENDEDESALLGFASDLLLTSVFNGIAAFGVPGALGSALLSTTYNNVYLDIFGESTSLDNQLDDLENRITAQFTEALVGNDLQNGLDKMGTKREWFTKCFPVLKAGMRDGTELVDKYGEVQQTFLDTMTDYYDAVCESVVGDCTFTVGGTEHNYRLGVEGWTTLKLATAEYFTMAEEYIALKSYFADDDDDCDTIYNQLHIQVGDFFRILEGTRSMLIERKEILLDENVYALGGGHASFYGWVNDYYYEKDFSKPNVVVLRSPPSSEVVEAAAELYKTESMWDMENFSYQMRLESNLKSVYEDVLKGICLEVRTPEGREAYAASSAGDEGGRCPTR